MSSALHRQIAESPGGSIMLENRDPITSMRSSPTGCIARLRLPV